jgi:hypothetical protein
VSNRKHLMTALADAGVSGDDYLKVQKARELVDEVNAAVAARGGTVAYAVTMVATEPVRPGGRQEITEGA